MNINDYNYELDESFIAQTPISNRSESKLMVLNRKTGDIEHTKFFNIKNYLKKGDVLVLNDTKVLPARLMGKKSETNANIEILLLKNIDGDIWECLARPGKRLHIGTEVIFNDKLKCVVREKLEDGIIKVEFIYEGIFLELIEEIGLMPLPPYIHESLEEQTRYQTVYAKYIGSAAAPTAGLHFTKKLLNEIEDIGVIVCYVTLHVGLGTFRPVEVDNILEHHMHSEYYEMTKEVADILNKAKKENRNIYAVGTTSTRVLETVANKYNEFKACSGNTDIFIYPGYKFLAINGLITNFHLPKSTLLMLVSALSKREYILNAYEIAKKNNYRFFSFGDAMFIK
ncbi:MAG: tRNA preQ1(34) S-adenosylmethionine ribosyltransferase-isomerase QueA [Firmicutes bacterium]|nr:tRNA preQ1(34) S-adenosylmethionine ribosyltransferase-isomerase QueA [Bacillota bacterium]